MIGQQFLLLKLFDNINFEPLYAIKMGPFFVSSSFLHFKKHQHFHLTWSLLGRNMPFLYTIKWYSTTRIKLNYTTTSAGCYKDWWLSKEWWQELRVSLETTLYMSTIIKYSKAVITSQLFFCIENLQFSFEKVFNIVDPHTYLPMYIVYQFIIYDIALEKMIYSGPSPIAKELSF